MGDTTQPTHEVFISYAKADKRWADAACAVLEAHRIRCWIAPRDITPGMEWGASIIAGIDGCKIMVLIFSTHANESPQVRREVERVISKGLTVLPCRVEDVIPVGAMEFALSNMHWLDAFTPPVEQQMKLLAESVQALLPQERGGASASRGADRPPLASDSGRKERLGESSGPKPSRRGKYKLVAAVGFSLFLLLAVSLAVAHWLRKDAVVTPEKTASALEPDPVGRGGADAFDDVPIEQLRVLAEVPNQELVVEWHGIWWPASVTETKSNQHLVSYKGWGPELDEWVSEDRMRYLTRPQSLKVDQDVLLEVVLQQGVVWYPAVVVAIQDGRIKLSAKERPTALNAGELAGEQPVPNATRIAVPVPEQNSEKPAPEKAASASEPGPVGLGGAGAFDEVPIEQLRVLGEAPNQELVVEWHGVWWPASVKETKSNQHLVGFKGWGPEFDEWVSEDRMRYLTRPQSFKVDQEVVLEVVLQRGAVWYPGVVVAIKDGRVKLSAKNAGELAGENSEKPASVPKVGDMVWSQWRPNFWFHGKVVKATEIGLHVAFDDGEQADLPIVLIAVDREPRPGHVKVGARVLAQWADGRFYPGTVVGETGDGKYTIRFDDVYTYTRVTALRDLRLIAAQPALSGPPKVGDIVWSQWRLNAWFHGKIVKATEIGLHVAFDDGGQADLPIVLVVVDREPRPGHVKVGARVLTQWTDGKLYPGTVVGETGDSKYTIRFDDGHTRVAALKNLCVW